MPAFEGAAAMLFLLALASGCSRPAMPVEEEQHLIASHLAVPVGRVLYDGASSPRRPVRWWRVVGPRDSDQYLALVYSYDGQLKKYVANWGQDPLDWPSLGITSEGLTRDNVGEVAQTLYARLWPAGGSGEVSVTNVRAWRTEDGVVPMLDVSLEARSVGRGLPSLVQMSFRADYGMCSLIAANIGPPP